MIYACGPEPMLEAVTHLAARFKRPSQVSVERVMDAMEAATAA
jgi:NAD(P)H-flavin reductase